MHSHLAFGGLRLVTGVALAAGMTVGYAPRAQAQAFSPAEIKGLTIWLDATDINGNGTNPPSGTAVQTWKNKAGAFDASQNNEKLRPTLGRDAPSGRDVVRFERPENNGSRCVEVNHSSIAVLMDKTNTAFAVARATNGNCAIVFSRLGWWDGIFFDGGASVLGVTALQRLAPKEKLIAASLAHESGDMALLSRIVTGNTSNGPSTIRLWKSSKGVAPGSVLAPLQVARARMADIGGQRPPRRFRISESGLCAQRAWLGRDCACQRHFRSAIISLLITQEEQQSRAQQIQQSRG